MDYFALEQYIVDRVREKVPELVEVERSSTYADRALTHWRPPSALVYLDTERVTSPDQRMPKGQRAHFATQGQTVEQTYIVLLGLRNARDNTGVAVRGEAGELISRVLVALAGWTPREEFWWPMVRVDGPEPIYPEPGKVWFPVAFQTVAVLTADRLAGATPQPDAPPEPEPEPDPDPTPDP